MFEVSFKHKCYSDSWPIRYAYHHDGRASEFDYWLTIEDYNKCVQDGYTKNKYYDFFDKDGNRLTKYYEIKDKEECCEITYQYVSSFMRYKGPNGKSYMYLDERNYYIQFYKHIGQILIICILLTIFIKDGWYSWVWGISRIIYGLWRQESIIDEENEEFINWQNSRQKKEN